MSFKMPSMPTNKWVRRGGTLLAGSALVVSGIAIGAGNSQPPAAPSPSTSPSSGQSTAPTYQPSSNPTVAQTTAPAAPTQSAQPSPADTFTAQQFEIPGALITISGPSCVIQQQPFNDRGWAAIENPQPPQGQVLNPGLDIVGFNFQNLPGVPGDSIGAVYTPADKFTSPDQALTYVVVVTDKDQNALCQGVMSGHGPEGS